MDKRKIIIQLIQQDLKHNQLLSGLEKLHLTTEAHPLEIMDVVAEMMGIPTGSASEEWMKIYISFLEEAGQYAITSRGERLLPLAEKCYNLLLACAEIERRVESMGEGK
ncbi:MAG: hypothetical protein H0V01_13915 [Bacteroidetes bacterium]|nr:hypothetical protein [Bacteroidota bacterium]HET6245382.1 hypothetical protein [Bacteroidia bacterium]